MSLKVTSAEGRTMALKLDLRTLLKILAAATAALTAIAQISQQDQGS